MDSQTNNDTINNDGDFKQHIQGGLKTKIVHLPDYIDPMLFTFDTKGGNKIEFTKPKKLFKTSIAKAFKKIDFTKCKLNDIEDGTIIMICAMYIIDTRFGKMAYAMDFDENIYKTNKSTAEVFDHISCHKIYNSMYEYKNIMISSDNSPIAIMTIVGDAEYNGYSYKKFTIEYPDPELSVRAVKFINDKYSKYSK